MKKLLFFSLLVMVIPELLAQDLSTQSFIKEREMFFEENRGQVSPELTADEEVLYVLRDKGVTLLFGKTGIRYRWSYKDKHQTGEISEATGLPIADDQNNALSTSNSDQIYYYDAWMNWVGASKNAEVIPSAQKPSVLNYYLDHCPFGVTGVKTFSQITYHNIYPNTDIVYYIVSGKLKYDVILNRGADLSKVVMSYSGEFNVLLNDGQLILGTPYSELREATPIAYTDQKEKVEVAFRMNKDLSVSFEIDGLKNNLVSDRLVIDPLLTWSTHFGGTGDEEGSSVSVNSIGEVFASGFTNSTAGISSGGHQNSFGGGSFDAFLRKFNVDGVLQWATYYGGTGNEYVRSSAVDASSVYITGETSSASVISFNGHQNLYGGGTTDGFLVKFSNTGVRQWGTYFGGSEADFSRSVVINTTGDIFIGGETTSPTGIASGGHQNLFGGGIDAFVTRFSSAGVLQWSTYYGGNGFDQGFDIAVDHQNSIYLVGSTNSSTSIAFNGHLNSLAGIYDAFVAKFSNNGTRIWATYFGGTLDESANSVKVDNNLNVYVGGRTNSTSGIFINGSYNYTQWVPAPSGYYGFLTKFNSGGSVVWGNYIPREIIKIRTDKYGSIFTVSKNAVIQSWLSKFTAQGVYADPQLGISYYTSYPMPLSATTLALFQSDIGGIETDAFGNLYLVGFTSMISGIWPDVQWPRFPLEGSHSGGKDICIVKFQWEDWLDGIVQNYSPTITLADVDSQGFIYSISEDNNFVYTLRKMNASKTLLWTKTIPFIVRGMRTDVNGNVYLAGEASASGLALNGHQSVLRSSKDAFLAKYNSSGTLLWATYYGGTGQDFGSDVAIDNAGNVYLSGTTYSSSFISHNGHDNTFADAGVTDPLNIQGDAFLVKFNSSGVRQWATYYGSSSYDHGYSVTVDTQGSVYLLGTTTNSTEISFNGHQNAYGGNSDAFIVKFNSTGVRQWATYYGGAFTEGAESIVADANNNIIVLGLTGSPTGIASGGAFQSTLAGSYDFFVAKFSSSGTRVWSSYFGGPGQEASFGRRSMSLDPVGDIYFGGFTNSQTGIGYKGFQINKNASELPNNFTPFVSKVSAGGTLIAGSYLFSYSRERGTTVAVSPSGDIYVGGDFGLAKLANFQSAPVSEPTHQPTAITFSNISATGLTVSYTLASGTPSGYLAIRRTGSMPTGNPSDGTVYTAGQAIGDGVVVYSGSLNSFAQSGLSAGTQYFYKVFSFNGFGTQTNYLTASPLSGSATTTPMAPEPVSQPTGFMITLSAQTSLDGAFTLATGSPKYLILGRAWDYPSFVPTDGNEYFTGQLLGDSYAVSSGSTSGGFSYGGLVPSTAYYFKIYAYNGSGATSNYLIPSPLIGDGVTQDDNGGGGDPIDPPCSFPPCPIARARSDNQHLYLENVSNNVTVNWIKSFSVEASPEIQRSNDGLNFSVIGNSWVASSDSLMIALDSKASNDVNDKFYYRVRYRREAGGIYRYSPVATIDISDSDNSSHVSPNPVDKQLFVNTGGGNGKRVLVSVMDGMGRTIHKMSAEGNFGIDTGSIPAGIYYLKLTFDSKKIETIKFIVVH